MKKLFVVALAAIGMMACVQENVTELPNGGEISFGKSFINNSTRAAVDPSYTVSTLGKFNVWGYVEQPEGTVFQGTEVTNNNGVGTYTDTQYWAPEKDYYFAAVAGVAADKVDATTAGTKPTAIAFENVDGTQDLLYAYEEVTSAPAGQDNDAVELEFDHILSKVKFSFTNAFTTSNVSVKAVGIKMNAVKKATYNIASAAWENQAESVDLAFGDTEAIAAATSAVECANERLLIPTPATQEYTISFTIKVYNGTVEVNSVEKTSKIKGVSFEQGKAYNLTAEITPESLGMDAIEFTVKVNDWEEANFDYDITNTIHIKDAAGLQEFADKVNAGEWLKAKVVLDDDIDLAGWSRASGACEWTPIGNGSNIFAGTFDGQGHKISNYQITTTEGPAGLFGYARATIKNLKVENVTIKANHYAGAIVGQGYMRIDKCEATNVNITVEVKKKDNGTYDWGDKAGGIIGQNCEGGLYVTNCKVKDVTIKGYRDLGGVVGMAHYGNTVSGCSAEGVTINQDFTNGYETDPTKTATVAGIVGRVGSPITLENNEATGVVITKTATVNTLEALEAAIDNGAVIVIAEDADITLENKTIATDYHKNAGAVITNKGKLTIKGGVISSTGDNGGSAIMNNGTLSVEDATLNGAPNAGTGWPAYTVNNQGTMTLTGCKITSHHGAVASYEEGAVLTMNDCEIDMAGIQGFTSHGVYTYNGGKVVINGGTYANKAADQGATGGSVINGNVEVHDGTFSGRIENYYGTPVLKGGVYTVNPAAKFVAEDYKVVPKGGKFYVVDEAFNEDTLVDNASDLAAAIQGGEVMLGGNVEWSSPINNDATIDLNGNTFEATHSYKLSNNADLTMKDGDYVVNGSFGHVDVRPSTAEGSELLFENVDFTSNYRTKAAVCTDRLGNVVEVCPDATDAHVKITFRNCTFDNAKVFFEGMSGKTGTFEALFENCTFKALTSSAPIEVQNYIKGTITVKGCTFNLECTSSSASAIAVSPSSSTSVTVNAENNTFNAVAATPYTYDASKGETEKDSVKVNGTPNNVRFIYVYGNTTVTETGTTKSGIAI
ncbi:MAG: hypothetical protein IKB18_04460 [Tidjanibacter sp.]|nr:hypothetical protein [Tidjanibacter sp.]